MGESIGRSALRVAGLTVTYGAREVLTDVDLEVPQRSSVSVMGSSGTGKSTLLSCVLGLLRPDKGRIEVDGSLVEVGRQSKTARLRREKMGVLFQSGELLPELSPLENVALPGLLAGMSSREAQSRASELLSQLGVPKGDRSVEEFSGGEQQRTAVARALINRPSLLLADEPTGSLDPQARDQVSDMLFEVPALFQCGLVVVTHDPVVAARATQQVKLVGGRLIEAALATNGRGR